MMKRLYGEERGQSLVIVVLAMVGLIAFLALVIDGGMAFAARRQMQNAADAAALAGTRELRDGGDEAGILAAVHTYAQLNGVQDPGVNVAAYFIDENLIRLPSGSECQMGTCGGIPTGAQGVEVIGETSFSTFFAGVIGRTELAASATAAAILSVTSGGEYAVWADSSTCNNCLDWSGSTTVVTGSVHSNHDIKMGGSSNTVTGDTEYVTDLQVGGSNNDINPVQTSVKPLPVEYEINDYRPGGSAAVVAEAEGKYHYIDGDFQVSQSYVTLDGLYYVTGNAKLSSSNISGNFTIVADGKIDVSGSNQNYTPYSDGLLFFSNKSYSKAGKQCNSAVIKVAGSTSVWAGVIYAPHGLIEMSGSSNSTVNGSLIGYSVKLNGSKLSIIYSSDYFPGEERIFLVK
jgi:hypothetical protein